MIAKRPFRNIGSSKYDYGPFGEVIRATGPMAKLNPKRFQTVTEDDETDLLYYGYRYYNPSTGRWLSKDPIEERGGANLYVFVGNDPLDKLDLIGLCTEQIGKNGLPRMVFANPGGGWSGGTVEFGGSAGGGMGGVYTTATATYTAEVTVLCTCPCGQRTGTRLYTQTADGTWPYYKPGGIGLGVPTATGVLSGLGKLGASWISGVIGANVMLQYEIDDAARTIAALPHPSAATDGSWKGGKSPCAQ